MVESIRVGILGASGYTGAELVRLLARHPGTELAVLTADRQAGRPMAAVFPHLAPVRLPPLCRLDAVDWSSLDLVFCALPHGTTQPVIAAGRRAAPAVRVVDLSADFRLADPAQYEAWYGQPHRAAALQAEAVYGLTELYRHAIAGAWLVANPGCYTTSAELPLIPLLETGLIAAEDIVIDAKSGVTGAGRGERLGSLHAEVSEGAHPYGVGGHRHMAEIEQELARAAGKPVRVAFTPHLMPMNRGIVATCYVALAGGATPADLQAALAARYDRDAFVHVLPLNGIPQTRHVRGSNFCYIGVAADRRPGHAIVVSVLDNLVKGAAGQAVQNMNVMFDWPETTGLDQLPLFP